MWAQRVGLRALDEIAAIGAGEAFLAHARSLAVAGNADWQFMLGYLALHRDNFSLPEARQWFEQLARQGHAESMYALAIAGVSDTTGRLRLATPVTTEGWVLVRRAAEAGSPNAQRMLACALAGGQDGLPRDQAAARAWHERAAEQTLRESQYDVGMMWLGGEGGPVGTERGLGWLELAADGPLVDVGALCACKALAGLYERGDFGVRKNGSRAGYYRERVASAERAHEHERARHPARELQAQCTRLIESILSLFPIEKPPERIVVHACDECDRVASDFQGKRWIDLDSADVDFHKDSVPLLSPEALAYYVPAYATEALRDPGGEIAGFALSSLKARRDLQPESAVSEAQQAVLTAVIDLACPPV